MSIKSLDRLFDFRSYSGSLSIKQVKYVADLLRNGGVCLLPSDTGYALAALPFNIQSMEALQLLLPNKLNSPISLAFSNLRLVEEFVSLSISDYRLIEEFMPGPLTLVCNLTEKLTEETKTRLSNILNTTGTLGIRIPDSIVERQISDELQRPITTSAIRDSTGSIVHSFDEAVDIINERKKRINKHILLVAIRANHIIKYGDNSTVISTNYNISDISPYTIYVFREGELPIEKIEAGLNYTSLWEIEDYT